MCLFILVGGRTSMTTTSPSRAFRNSSSRLAPCHSLLRAELPHGILQFKQTVFGQRA